MPKKAKKKATTVTEKLLKEQEVTENENAKRHAANVAEEAEKVKATKEAVENQAFTVTRPQPLPAKDRKTAWEEHLKAYKKQNPVKFAIKEKSGHFKEIPDNFTGKDQLYVSA